MIIVEVPATSANCSIGFDCLGMALDWHARFIFEESDELIVQGCPEEYCNEDNLVVQTFADACAWRNMPMPAFKLTIESDIPFARGLGSSSCCVAAGLAAANAWLRLDLTHEELLKIATKMEGHPDNAAPALFGSMNACFLQGDDIVRVRFDCASYHVLAVIPPYEVSTPEARKVLPSVLPYKEAVSQVGHALVFEKALEDGDETLLYTACEDHLHEPFRKELIPHYDQVKAMADAREVPFWISGSGPTMLMLSRRPMVLENIRQQLEEEAPELATRMLKVSREGTKVITYV